MKVNHFRQMMRYLTRPPDNQKGKFVKVRKPNAVPPKTKTIQKFNKGGAPRSKFNQTLGKLRVKGDPEVVFKDIKYDADLGRFVNTKTGETGTLDYFRDKELYSEEKLFEPILDRLQNPKKKIAKKPIKNGDPKPNGADPNPNVIPFPFDKIEDAPNWYDTFRDPKLNLSVEEYLQQKQREYEADLEKNLTEEALKVGIGKLFRKKIV